MPKIFRPMKFLKTFAFAMAVSVYSAACASPAEPKIDGADLYLINVDVPRHFSFGNWNSRQHLILRVRAGNSEGWGECVIGVNNPGVGLQKYADGMKFALGKTPSGVLEEMRANRKILPWNPYEALNMALWDLRGKFEGKPSAELLGLNKSGRVSGMFCILENDPARVVERAEVAKKDGFSDYIKLKIFGNADSDCALISALRKAMGPKCFIVADANCGYKGFADLQELAGVLSRLSEAGLNAVEDPAKLSEPEMVELQKLCRPFGLSLIPDVNLRPAWRALEESPGGMGDFYNLHPGCMGDLYDMARLAEKIYSGGAKIMIGDDSLIGPGCQIYQQIASAVSASWCEALEKPGESSAFLDCLKSSPVFRLPGGKIAAKRGVPGWGLEVDSQKLGEVSARKVSIFVK